MDDVGAQGDHEELSKDDLQVLQAFHDLEFSTSDNSSSPLETTLGTSFTYKSEDLLSEDEMLILFATEVDEDITKMRLAMKQIEQDNSPNSQGMKVLKRCTHKVAGTAAAIGCASMSTIARHLETVLKLVEESNLSSQTTLIALQYSIQALEDTLHSLVSNGFESKNPLLSLEEEYQKLNIDVQSAGSVQSPVSETTDNSASQWFSPQAHELNTKALSLRVNAHHFNNLQENAENSIELDIPFEQAQKQVETALNELLFAQTRLRRLEPLLSSLTFSTNPTLDSSAQGAGYPPSSLVARILQEASTHATYAQPLKLAAPPQPLFLHEAALWDELEIDRFSETNVLTQALNEAITDVALATTHVQQAVKNLKSIVAQQVRQANAVRNEAFLLRTIPFSFLVARLQAAIEKIAGPQSEHIHIQVSGETVEIDQDVLEKLADPLLELVQMQVAEVLFFKKRSEQASEEGYQIGFHAYTMNNEISIEINFLQPVPAGTVAFLQETIHHLYGSVFLQENNPGTSSLQIRLPRSQRMIQGLLVRAGSQQVLVSVSQIKRIHFNKQRMNGEREEDRSSQDAPLTQTHEIYHLTTLLGLQAHANAAENDLQSALILEMDSSDIAIEVDEVVKEVELVIKPLSEYLYRPGITSTAVDANGNVLLVLNLLEMIQQKEVYKHIRYTGIDADAENDHESIITQTGPEVCQKILIADDSIYIRQSLNMSLSHEGYSVIEAVDGLEALDQLSKEAPDLLLLDIEMPNLNGYDVLSIVRSHQEFSALKIIMLTSRSSEKHKRRANELGANAYLMKPCSHDDLLVTIKSLFNTENEHS